MNEHNTIEITNFKLQYDGCFKVLFDAGGVEKVKHIYLPPDTLFRILKNEGFDTIKKIGDLDFSRGITCSKSMLTFEVCDNSDDSKTFITSEWAESYQDYGIFMVKCGVKTEKQRINEKPLIRNIYELYRDI